MPEDQYAALGNASDHHYLHQTVVNFKTTIADRQTIFWSGGQHNLKQFNSILM